MRSQIVFLFVFVALMAFAVQTEAAPAWDGWEKLGKDLEGAGQRVFKVAKDVLPVAQGYLEVYKGFKGDDDKGEN